jgi:hypothetical protein
MPQRIQRRRTKGWRMPAGAVYVGRGSKWGNPYRVGQCGELIWLEMTLDELLVFDFAPRKEVIDGHEMTVRPVPPNTIRKFPAALTIDDVLRMYRGHLLDKGLNARELRGKDLVCWCRLDQRCHADVLLDLANR